MEKFNHLQILKDSIDFERIPTLIEKPDFSVLLKNNLKSGALENLISQNEDLNVRFRVLLRRLAILEEENLRFATENKEYKHQIAGVTDQISIYKEKENSFRQRTLAAEEAMDMNQAMVRKKEIEFAKMRTQDWQEKEHYKKHIEKIDKQRFNLIRYRTRIQLYVKPFIKKLREKLTDLGALTKHQAKQIESMGFQTQKISEHNKALITQHREQIQKMEEVKLNIVIQFEKYQTDLKNELKSLKELNHELSLRSERLDKSLERQDYLENRVIEADRIISEIKQKYREEFDNIQKQFYYWRNHAQSLEVQNHSLSEKYNETHQSLNVQRDLANRLQEQLEALRHLWTDSSQETSRLRSCNEALEKLNSDLCIKLNEARNDKINPESLAYP
jgi:chromosome segregation ATPase